MKKSIGFIVSLMYAYPFVFFAMYMDFLKGSLWGYFIMIASTSILAVISKLIMQKKLIIFGNLISFFSSIYFVYSMQALEGWDVFFKPLTAMQLLLIVSLLNIVPQYFIMKRVNGK